MKTCWRRFVLVSFAAGAGAGAYYYLSGGNRGPAELFVAGLIAAGSAWLGALLGGFFDWMRLGRTGLEPLFPGRFPWFYRQRYWRRFALVFAAAWTIFVLLAASVAMLAGEKEEALFFFTPKGASVIVIFIVIFAAEGAMVGGLIDLFARFFRKS